MMASTVYETEISEGELTGRKQYVEMNAYHLGQTVSIPPPIVWQFCGEHATYN